jgi:hypothetical protein
MTVLATRVLAGRAGDAWAGRVACATNPPIKERHRATAAISRTQCGRASPLNIGDSVISWGACISVLLFSGFIEPLHRREARPGDL